MHLPPFKPNQAHYGTYEKIQNSEGAFYASKHCEQDAKIRIWISWKRAKLGIIDFTIGLPINIDVNDEQNKFEVHISKNEAKIPNFKWA